MKTRAMPSYLGIDFLSEVLKQKDLLLGRMLISCLEPCEDESVPFSRYTKNMFDWCLAKASQYDIENTDPATYLYEIQPSSVVCIPEQFLSLRNTEYTPCSGPNFMTTDSYSDFEDEIVKDVCEYLFRHEIDYEKYDELHLSNSVWQLEELEMKDCFRDFLCRMPHYQDLVSRLRQRKVSDPLLAEDGCLRSEYQLICSTSFDDAPHSNSKSSVSNESFAKIYIPCQIEKFHLMSPLIDSPYTFHRVLSKDVKYHPIALNADCNEKSLQELQALTKQVKLTKPEFVMTKQTTWEVKNFLDINSSEETRDLSEKKCINWVLESPQLKYRNKQNEVNEQVVDIDKFHHCKLDNKDLIRVLSPELRKKCWKKIYASNSLPQELSYFMFCVPEIDDPNVKTQGTINVEHSLRESENLQKDLDQQLSWNPVRELTKINICNNRFTNSLPRPESSTKMSNFIVELNDGYEKILWKDVYDSRIDGSSLAVDLTKGMKSHEEEVKKNIFSEVHSNISSSLSTKEKEKQGKHHGILSSLHCNNRKRKGFHSGIDDFILLRTGVRSTSSSPPKAVVKAITLDQQDAKISKSFLQEKGNTIEDITDVIDIHLNNELQAKYIYVENCIESCLVYLKQTGCLASSYSAGNINGDYTRFLLKQEEKKNLDRSDTRVNHSYMMLIVLHTLVTTAESIRECGLSVALANFQAMWSFYKKELNGFLDEIMANLMIIDESLKNAKKYHPKVVATYNYIVSWQPNPSSLTLDEKILIILFRGFHHLSTIIVRSLEDIKGLKIATITKNNSQVMVNDAHVFICDPTDVPYHFSWSSFKWFITFTQNKTKELENLLQGVHLKGKKIICFRGVTSGDININPHGIDAQQYFNEDLQNQEIYTLIGSSKITKNAVLLRCLEQKCGIVIIEREYDIILKNTNSTSSKLCRQPDLILDQRTAVIIENIRNFACEDGYKDIVDLVLSTSFKCEVCSIILLCDPDNFKYSFVGEVQSNLAKFHGCLLSIQLSFENFVIDIHYSQSIKDAASLIRELCDTARDSSHLINKQDWINREWLADECSQNERFLLGFPSLNSFSAQMMLNVLPLSALLSSSFVTLKEALPRIPEDTLKKFRETTECGLNVDENEEDYTIQIPRFPIDEDEEMEEKHDFRSGAFNSIVNMDKEHQMSQSAFALNSQLSYERDQRLTSFPRDSFTNRYRSMRNFADNNVHQCQKQHESNLSQRINFEIEDNRGESMDRSGFLRRISKKRGFETRDVVGVVQPKPRETIRFRNTNSGVCQPSYHHVTSHPDNIWCENDRDQEKNVKEVFLHSLTGKPAEKKKKLTYETVPGAKNGQTRLTFV